MKRLINKEDFHELEIGDRLVRLHRGEATQCTYACPHPLKGRYSQFSFVVLGGSHHKEFILMQIPKPDSTSDIWFKVEKGGIDRSSFHELLQQQLDNMKKQVNWLYARKSRLPQ